MSERVVKRWCNKCRQRMVYLSRQDWMRDEDTPVLDLNIFICPDAHEMVSVNQKTGYTYTLAIDALSHGFGGK